jgi:phage tail sheath protein FI
MINYRTPNVYIKEESNLPPSVSQVSTAIPAFIGYTEKGFIILTFSHKLQEA